MSKVPKKVEIVFPKDSVEPNKPITFTSNPFGQDKKAKSHIGFEHIDLIITYKEINKITNLK